ncbi:LysR family transcriptional regulator [Anaerosinus massiliensis]|uniref:LysR family transcriptional regulator n=1 Tax=Massilibacillus massiliensis TaxID=1806837 RepID=UPI000DA620A4|nr:LysR family transcriptional regulator [Massilibacillus massiliensis]
MEDRDWLIIQALKSEKNITKAAQSLYMSQPALTARLQHIEREFGVQLVHRSTKGIQITPEGEFLVKAAEQMVTQLRSIKNNVRNLSKIDAGTLEIGASHYFTMYTLPHILKLFKKKYPNADFNMVTDWTKNIFSLIYNKKTHVGFVSVDYGGCKNMHLLYEEPVCIASMQPFKFEDLPNLSRIEYHSDYLLKSQIDKWWRENFAKPPTFNMHVDKLATCKEMVKNGLGYAILPSRIIANIPNIHKLPLKNTDGKYITRKTWMIYNEDTLQLPIVNLFVNFVKGLSFEN